MDLSYPGARIHLDGKRLSYSAGVPADCQIEGCGVLAIGRCQTCDRAFCASHQARNGATRFVDLCGACQVREREQKATAAAADRERFLNMVRACESQPFPRLLTGAVLKETVHPTQRTPWCLYDPKFDPFSPRFDGELSRRIALDFVEEAQRRGVQPERRVRSGRSVTKGFLLPRKRWEDIYGHGWVIPAGSNLVSGGKSDGFLGAVVWTDGDVTADRPDNTGARLREAALPAMARMLGVNTTPPAA